MNGDVGLSRAGHETARLQLARVRVERDTARETAVQHAARICALALDVERVGVWMLEPDALVAATQYQRSGAVHTSGRRILNASCPVYIAALQERRAIVAHDARTDPATRELAENYLIPMGITSLLDAPLYRRGEVVGVVCHEHVGPARRWTQTDIDFASSVADMLGMIFEQADNLVLEAELRSRAARLRDAERLDTLVRLAGGVAHDFNNVLTAIALISSGLEKHTEADVSAKALTLSEAVALGKQLVERLSSLARLRAANERDADIDLCLETLQRLIDPLVRGRAIMTVSNQLERASAALPTVQLMQVLLNLCLNAAEAMERPGTIALRVRAPTQQEGGDEMVVIEVEDDGAGISDDVQDSIFNPYFTTKETGTGLGLPTVRDIVTEHGGSVVVDRGRDRGTTFLVVLPRGQPLRSH